MSFKILMTVWCATSLLAGGGLVVWFVVELKIFVGWCAARRARRYGIGLPKARWLRRTSLTRETTTNDSARRRKIHF